MLVIGEKERASGTVAVRRRDGVDLGPVALDEIAARLAAQGAQRLPALPDAEEVG
jgi:threonyl-tRNA synthetase